MFFSDRIFRFRFALPFAAVTLGMLAAGEAAAAPTITNCVPEEVGTFADHIYVRCASAVGGITTFATPTSDATHAARVLSLLSTAQVAGRTLSLTYEPTDTTGPNFGCPAKDCRLLIGAQFGK